MQARILVDGKFLRYGGTVIARGAVSHAEIETGNVFMIGGGTYTFPPDVVRRWFEDVLDDNPAADDALNNWRAR